MTVFLETKRLIVKAPSVSDLDNWGTLHAESDVMPYPKETVQKWLNHHILEFQQNGFSMGSVFLKDTKEFIGRAGLFYSPDLVNQESVIELGYVINKKYWNQGYATELAYALLDWGFNQLKIKHIIALTLLDNKKSQHILQKIGMRYIKKVKSEGEDFLLYEIRK